MKKILILLLTFSMVISLLAVLPSCSHGIPAPSSDDKKLLDGMMDSCDWEQIQKGETFSSTLYSIEYHAEYALSELNDNEYFNKIMEKDNAIDILLWKLDKTQSSLFLSKDEKNYILSMYYLFKEESIRSKMTEDQIDVFNEIVEDYFNFVEA